MQKITPFLWFDTEAEEAAKFYISIFKNSRILNITRYGDTGPGPKRQRHDRGGRARWATIHRIERRSSFQIHRGDRLLGGLQDAERSFWEKLSQGGKEVECGWLKDKYGLSWQIVPTVLPELIRDPDPAKSKRVMAAMLKMKKIDIAGLEKAYRG